jgi:hypothetical protein
MSGGKPMRPEEIQLNKISYSDVKTLDNGAKICYLNYDGGPLYIQSPELTLPFDSTYYQEGSDGGKVPVKVNVPIKNAPESSQVKLFHDSLVSLDKKIMNDASENSLAWFKKKSLTLDTIENLYTPQIRVSVDAETGEPNDKWDPQFPFKVVKRKNKWLCKFYDDSKTKMNLVCDEANDGSELVNKLKKGSKVKLLIKCMGIWIASGKFGCTWRAEQMIITTPESLDDFAFRSDEEEDHEGLGSDDEDEDDEDDEEVVQPKKRTTK